MSQKLRNYTENRTKPNENNVEEFVSSQTKRQFGVSSQNKGFLSTSQQQPQGLKQQFIGQKNDLFKDTNNSDNQKLQKPPSLTPQKRTESAVGLTCHSASKKQTVRKIEQTYRRREQEAEYVPEGLDLDFNVFESSATSSSAAEFSYEQNDSMFEDDMDQYILTTAPRRFTVAQDTIEEEFAAPFNEQVEKGDGSEEASAVSFNEEVEQEEPVFYIQEDFSTVEYGPPKEIEIPFKPHKSCIIDFDQFSDYADLEGYELARLFDKDNLDFVLDDVDALKLVAFNAIDNDALVFACEFDDINEVEMFSEDDLCIPFNDYQFDAEHYSQCYPPTPIVA